MPEIYTSGNKVFVQGENSGSSIPLGEDNLGVVTPGEELVVGDVELNVQVSGNSGSLTLNDLLPELFVDGGSTSTGTNVFEDMPFWYEGEDAHIISVTRNSFDYVIEVVVSGLRFGSKTISFDRDANDKIILVHTSYNGVYTEYTPVYDGVSIVSWI